MSEKQGNWVDESNQQPGKQCPSRYPDDPVRTCDLVVGHKGPHRCFWFGPEHTDLTWPNDESERA